MKGRDCFFEKSSYNFVPKGNGCREGECTDSTAYTSFQSCYRLPRIEFSLFIQPPKEDYRQLRQLPQLPNQVKIPGYGVLFRAFMKMGVLLLLKGFPGCGKSTLGRALAATLGWPLIDKDDARDCLQTLVADCPSVDWNNLSYEIMFSYLETQLSLDLDGVIVDSPLARRVLFDRAEALARKVRFCIRQR